MRQVLWHWYYLLPATIRLVRVFLQAYFYWKFRVRKAVQLPQDKTLSAAQIKRWEHYFYGTTFLSAVFCQLLGRGLRRPTELQTFANLAALACFFDDLTDQNQPDKTQANSPEQYGQMADKSGIAQHFLKQVYATLPAECIAEFKFYLNRIFYLETAKQQPTPRLAELEKNTAEKGASSVLLFRCLLAEPISKAEKQALAAFGSLIQLCDDIFDLWFDLRQGIPTLATVLAAQNDLEQLNLRFNRQVNKLNQAVLQVPVSAYQRETTLRILRFLTSITRVCLRHYQRLQKKHGTLPLEVRSDMVVDMALWRYRLEVVAALLKPI